MLLLFLALLQTTAAVKPPTISGKVIDDMGQPVRRARIVMRLGNSGWTSFSAMTNTSGVFEIRDVDPGGYSLNCTKTGYIATPYRTGKSTMAQILTLTAGQEATEVNFVLARTASISGTVLDDDGDPV